MTREFQELTLTGPDGGNPLGFLSALGTLRVLSLAWPQSQVMMSWQQERATWRPILGAYADLRDREALVTAVLVELKNMNGHPAQKWDGTHNIPQEEYRKYSLQCATDRRSADLAATFACDAVIGSKGNVADTAFRTMSGQGHQHFLKQMRLLSDVIKETHVHEALFGPWLYADEKLNTRWDPVDDRRHAMRWKSPDKDPIKTVWGANRLAAEGLPFYPVFPIKGGRSLLTAGFRLNGRDDTFWTWPIWQGFLSPQSVKSTLALPELQQDAPPRQRLSAMGICEVYRSQRITVGRFRAFTPGQPV